MVLTMFFVLINRTFVMESFFKGVRGAIATNPSLAEFPAGEAIRRMSDITKRIVTAKTVN